MSRCGKKGGIPKKFHTDKSKDFPKNGNYLGWIAGQWNLLSEVEKKKYKKGQGNNKNGACKKKKTTAQKKGKVETLPTATWVASYSDADTGYKYREWAKKHPKASPYVVNKWLKENGVSKDGLACFEMRRNRLKCIPGKYGSIAERGVALLTTLARRQVASAKLNGDIVPKKPIATTKKPTATKNQQKKTPVKQEEGDNVLQATLKWAQGLINTSVSSGIQENINRIRSNMAILKTQEEYINDAYSKKLISPNEHIQKIQAIQEARRSQEKDIIALENQLKENIPKAQSPVQVKKERAEIQKKIQEINEEIINLKAMHQELTRSWNSGNFVGSVDDYYTAEAQIDGQIRAANRRLTLARADL